MIDGLVQGFALSFQPENLLWVFLGVLIGTVIGVLPGLGPVATIALLLPLTYALDPTTAVIFLAGIYYGSMYGGTITSVLLSLPGEAASVVTTFDGYQMAKQGKAGPALGISAIGSFIGGTLAVIGLTLFAPLLSDIAVRFSSPEFFALALLAILMVTYLGTKSPVKSLCMAGLGLLLASIGQDPINSEQRFTFGVIGLWDGVDFVAVAMGLFGVGEILYTLEKQGKMEILTTKVSHIMPNRKDLKASAGPIGRGSVLGFLIGLLPGGGGVISSMASYAMEKKLAKDPSRFGKGAIEGVAGPETANNASSTASFIPLLTLGIPANVVLALIFGALLVQGITPGPLLIEQHPDIFWGVIASMYIGNIMLLVLNLPLVGVFVQILRVRAGILASFALVVTMAGVYSINNDIFDMWVVVIFGLLGWLLKRTGFEPGPLVLAFILGPILESAFRRSMLMSQGDFSIFATRPYSAGILILALAIVVFGAIGAIRKNRGAPGPVEGQVSSGEHGSQTTDSPVDSGAESRAFGRGVESVGEAEQPPEPEKEPSDETPASGRASD